MTPADATKAVLVGFARGEKAFGVKARGILCCIRAHPNWSHDILQLAKENKLVAFLGLLYVLLVISFVYFVVLCHRSLRAFIYCFRYMGIVGIDIAGCAHGGADEQMEKEKENEEVFQVWFFTGKTFK